MALKRMDNVEIVVGDQEVRLIFREFALVSKGGLEGEWAGRVARLGDQCVEIAMMRTPDGGSQLELCPFLAPLVVAGHGKASMRVVSPEPAGAEISASFEFSTPAC